MFTLRRHNIIVTKKQNDGDNDNVHKFLSLIFSLNRKREIVWNDNRLTKCLGKIFEYFKVLKSPENAVRMHFYFSTIV